MKKFICPNCADERPFQGLCRDCTEYGEEGTVLTPVRRVKNTGHVHIHDENCNHDHDHDHDHGIQITDEPFFRRTREDFLNARRRKPTKRQMKQIVEAFESASSEEEE